MRVNALKDQYVGDISDYEKYGLLRALSASADLPLAICWMLTAPDTTGEVGRTVDRPARNAIHICLDELAENVLFHAETELGGVRRRSGLEQATGDGGRDR